MSNDITVEICYILRSALDCEYHIQLEVESVGALPLDWCFSRARDCFVVVIHGVMNEVFNAIGYLDGLVDFGKT